jgi:hypothetical protein
MSGSMSAKISVWEDDPGSGGPLVTVRAPALPKSGLAFAIEDVRAPPPDLYPPGNERFSYWAAVEGLTRSIGFWSRILTSLNIDRKWQNRSKRLKIRIRSMHDLNAFYSRDSIEFGYSEQDGVTISLCDSPEVIAHSVGKAILDTVRPELWDAASDEVAAFHESFASASEVLSTLQLESYRKAIIKETGGYLHHASRLTRSSEQLGDAIRKISPTAVPSVGVKEIFTPFLYQDPSKLFPSSPSNNLSSEPHSFSRVFAGAFIQTLSAAFRSTDLSPESLLKITFDMGVLLVGAVRICPIAAAFFSSVAGAMLGIDKEQFGGRYEEYIRSAFVERNILSTSGVRKPAKTDKKGSSPPPAPAVEAPPPSEGEWIATGDERWQLALLEHLRKMDPTQFEKLFGIVLERSGFKDVQHLGRTGDGGIDLVCIRERDFDVDRYYVQCKRYVNKITSPQIRDFKGAMSGRGDRGMFVTTSSFTEDADIEAKREGTKPLSLIDGVKLCNRLLDLKLGIKSKEVTFVLLDLVGLDNLRFETAYDDADSAGEKPALQPAQPPLRQRYKRS